MTDRVRITGAYMTAQGRLPESAAALATEAAIGAMKDAGTDAQDLAAVFLSNALGGGLCDQDIIRGQSWLRDAGLGNCPMVNVENACAGGVSALHLGTLACKAGAAPVLIVGVEKMWTGSRASTLAAIEHSVAASDRSLLKATLANASGSLFMGLNALWARRQLEEKRAELDHFAAVVVKARRHAFLNPLAQHRSTLTAEEVLASPLVAEPLTRHMCSSFTDGAAAVVMTTEKRFNAPEIIASVLAAGDGTLEYHERMGLVSSQTWSEAGVGPSDLDVLEVHDASSPEELYTLETIGAFPEGEAGEATVRGLTTFGGSVVVNPSGGLLARGHPLGATGVCQVVELVQQLRGDGGGRQVEGARHGALVNTGGIVGSDAACIGMQVLRRTGAAPKVNKKR